MKFTGSYIFQDFIQMPEIILRECQSHGIYKMLIRGEELKDTDASTIDRFFIGEKIAEVLRSKVKLAVVWPPIHMNKLTESVAINRAAYMRMFVEQNEAKKWLLDKDAREPGELFK
ncbi:hypothetical protein OO009_07635 [Flavobacteriaceae bacterium KMM 6897]|nr:hypothetical protein [Flavobacteriaceae bacterium KMM 6897]MEB8345561.1 hypothetical protein [Flavobacteriaceae bacterium KMM 6898]